MRMANLFYVTRLLTAALLSTLISACNGGSSTSPGPVLPPAATNVVSGQVVDAFVAGATVTAYQLSAAGTQGALISGSGVTNPVTTDASGNYSLNLGSYTGPVYLTSVGGTYTDTASGAMVNLAGSGLTLLAILPSASGKVTAEITPMTTMAAQSVPTLLLDGQGSTTAVAATNANALISNFFGISNILNTALLDLTKAGCTTGASQGSIDASLILAAISQLAISSKVSTPDLMQALIQDVTSDGKFDGKASGTPLNVNLASGSGTVSLASIEGNALTAVAASLAAFASSASNTCKAEASQLALAALSNPGIFSTPSAPTNVTATAGNGQVTVAWNPVTGASSYNVYVATATGVKKVPAGLPGYASYLKVTSPDVLKGLTNGTSYYFVVTALNGVTTFGSESAESAEVTATPAGSSNVAVAISPGSPQSVGVNGTISFTATVTGATNQAVTWSVAPSGCGAISSSGMYTAPAAAAICAVTATSAVSPNSASVTVNVTAATVTLSSISLLPSAPTIAVGTAQQFMATGTYSDQSTKDLTTQVTWSSANTAVATISTLSGSNGLTTALAAGTSTISATLAGVTGRTQLTVQAASHDVVALSTGFAPVMCAQLSDATAKCWGFDLFGNLGDGRSGASVDAVPSPVLAINLTATNPAKGISAGMSTCAVLTDGTIQCWGANNAGTFGNGTTTNSIAPVVAYNNSANNPAEQVSVGAYSACGLFHDGTVQCWGSDYAGVSVGLLGNGTVGYSLTPVPVNNITASNPATAISVGYDSACALMAGGTVQCWGYNYYGELGTGSFTGPQTCTNSPCSTVPVTVTGISGVTNISVGGSSAMCAVKSDGTVWCWGSNAYYQLGGASGPNADVPVQIGGITTAKSVSVGGDSACALLADGTVMCWGYDAQGQAGNGAAFANNLTPVAVIDITSANPATAISTNAGSTCALLQDGTVWCWGQNTYGTLGNGTTSTTGSSAPAQVSGL